MKSMLWRGLPLSIAVLAACGGDKATGPTLADISGTWNTTAVLTDKQYGLTCSVQEHLILQQSGRRISGGGTQAGFCLYKGIRGDATSAGIVSGELDGNILVLTSDGGCSYTASIVDANHMRGQNVCTARGDGFTIRAAGDWYAIRQISPTN